MSAVHALGDWRQETARYVRVAGAWRRVTGVAVRIAGAWHTATSYAATFSASAPDEVDGYQNAGDGARVYVSTDATVTVAGGTGPYTYQWAHVSGDARVGLQNATMATANFGALLISQTITAVFSWQAIDASGQTASGQTTVTLTAENGFQ